MDQVTQSVVVVGGSSGLGKVVALRYAAEGCQVVVVSRKRPSFIEGSDRLGHVVADLSTLTTDRAQALVAEIVAQRGCPSYIVFCQRYRGTERNFANELCISITATELLIEAFIPHFATEGDRAIVSVSSVYADYVGSSQPLSYHIVKAGLNALVRFYAVKLGAMGIRSNAIAPLTYLKDESKHMYLGNSAITAKYEKLVPLKRMPTADECANTIRYLGSSQSSFINGQILRVDGGVSVIWPEEIV